MGRRKNPETKEEIQAELIYAEDQIRKLKNQEKMYANAYENEWSGITADYRRKKGVVYSEIMLPANAPASFYDRATLWNSVEMCEKRRDSQPARDIEVSLPKELPLSEHKKIMQDYCSQFVDAGMCVDFNIHDKGDGNPHIHQSALCFSLLFESG